MKNTRISRAAAALTALAAVAAAAGIVTGSVQALPPGTAATPGQTLSPTSGNESTSFTLSLASPNNVCPGDTATGGFRWNQYITSRGVDAATLTWDASGPIVPAGSPVGSIAQPLYSTAGSPQVNKNTAVNTGQITGTSTLNFALNTLAAGEYKIGFACSKAGQTERYWQTLITVTAAGAGINWQQGVKPDAPVLASPLTVDNAQIAGSFSHAASDPATSGFTVTAVPVGGGTTVTKAAATAGAFTLGAADGVVNGKQYDVSVVATNALGDSPASNTVRSPLVAPPALPGVTNLTATPGVELVDLTWTTPAAGASPVTGYSIAITDGGVAIAGSPFTAGAGATSFQKTGLTAGTTYQAVVTPTHAAPFVGTASAPVSFTPFGGTILVQNIEVDRPVGALVITQRCGVYGSAAAVTDNVFGALPSLPAVPTNADPGPGGYSFDGGVNGLPVGTAPTQGVGGAADPNFTEYPYPVDANGVPNPTYPTNCGVDLGIGSLLTVGPKAGQYFAVNGRINQITVVNTQDVDGGWTLNGVMSDFVKTGAPTEKFSGNLLGWNPEVTYDSAANLDGYDMVVTAGAVREPVATAGNGLGSNKALASSAAGASLGMSVVDARLRLLIPVTADSGTYTGTLTFTTI